MARIGHTNDTLGLRCACVVMALNCFCLPYTGLRVSFVFFGGIRQFSGRCSAIIRGRLQFCLRCGDRLGNENDRCRCFLKRVNALQGFGSGQHLTAKYRSKRPTGKKNCRRQVVEAIHIVFSRCFVLIFNRNSLTIVPEEAVQNVRMNPLRFLYSSQSGSSLQQTPARRNDRYNRASSTDVHKRNNRYDLKNRRIALP